MEFTDFNEIIIFAIEKEEMSCKFYSQASRIVKDKKVQDLCVWLSQEEKKHIQILKKFTEDHDSHFLHQTLEESNWIDTKVIREIHSEMNLGNILILAIKHEKKSLDFYSKMSDYSKDGQCSELFGLLAKEEKKHLLKLNHTLSNFKDL